MRTPPPPLLAEAVSDAGAYVPADARHYVWMAELVTSHDPVIPNGWRAERSFEGVAQAGSPVRVKGMFISGLLPGWSKPRLVLTLGIAFEDYLVGSVTAPTLGSVKALGRIAPDNPHLDPDPTQISQALDVFLTAYQAVQLALWGALAKLQSDPITKASLLEEPLMVVGRCLGAPLAQLATADMMGRGPGQGLADASPPSDVRCYTFSAAPFANAAFAKFFAQVVPHAYRVRAGTSGTQVDFFPAAPGEPDDPNGLGALEQAAIAVPSLGSPWFERGSSLYADAIAQTKIALRPPEWTTAVDFPSGFEQELARLLALTCVGLYEAFQHPNGPRTSTAPLQPVRTFETDGGGITNKAPWALGYTADVPERIVVSFRGAVTSNEWAQVTAHSIFDSVSWFPEGGQAHRGALALYLGMRDEIREFVSANASKSLYFCGHGLGGVLALLAAWDHHATLAGVYTFGSFKGLNALFTGGSGYDATCGAKTYQLVRPADFAPRTNFGGANMFVAARQQVLLPGCPDDATYEGHAISDYARLLALPLG